MRARMEEAAEMTSTSHGPWKLDIRNWGMAKAAPAASRAGQTSIIPLKPVKAQTSQKGTRMEKKGKLPPDHGAQLVDLDAGDAGQGDDRRSKRSEGHGGRVGDERQSGSGQRAETEADEDGRGHGDGGAEAGRSLEKRTEGKGDEEELQPPVPRDSRQAFLKDFERSFIVGQRVEEDDVQDDPTDGEKPVGGAEEGNGQGLIRRHAENQDRNGQGRSQTEEGRRVGLKPEEGQRSEQDEDGQGGEEGRDDPVSEGIIDLVPRHGPLFSRLSWKRSTFDNFCRHPL